MTVEDQKKRLRERISDAIGGAAKVGKKGIPRTTIDGWVKGPTLPKLGQFLEFCEEVGRDPASFFNEVPKKIIQIQKLDVLPAAGAGATNDALPVAEALEFPLWMAKKLTKTARGKVASLRFMRALGDSMEPLIEPGALLLVDESDVDHRRSPKPRKASDHNNIYVFLQDGALRVKRLRVDRKGATIALSDNPAYDPEFLHKQDFKVLGRVIWWDNRL